MVQRSQESKILGLRGMVGGCAGRTPGSPPPRNYVHRLPYLELLRQVNIDLSAQCSEFVLCRHSPSRGRRSGSCPLHQIRKSCMAFPVQGAVRDWGGWGRRLRLCPRSPAWGPWLRPCPPSHSFRNRCLGVCPRYRVIVGSGVLCIRIPWCPGPCPRTPLGPAAGFLFTMCCSSVLWPGRESAFLSSWMLGLPSVRHGQGCAGCAQPRTVLVIAQNPVAVPEEALPL